MKDLTDKDGVVTGFDYLGGRAFELRQNTVQQRHSGIAESPRETLEAVALALGKANGQIALMLFENIDSEHRIGAEVGQGVRTMIDTDENQRRAAGDGSKGVRGKAVRQAIFTENSGDGDAGGKACARASEGCGADRGQALERLA
jgi:hypothetical protein